MPGPETKIVLHGTEAGACRLVRQNFLTYTWSYGVHRTCAETAAVSCGTSHASAVSTPLRWIFNKNNNNNNNNTRYKEAAHSCGITYQRSEPAARERRIAVYKSDQQQLLQGIVSRYGLAVRRSAGKQRDLGSNPLRLSFLFKSCGLWTLSCEFVPHN